MSTPVGRARSVSVEIRRFLLGAVTWQRLITVISKRGHLSKTNERRSVTNSPYSVGLVRVSMIRSMSQLWPTRAHLAASLFLRPHDEVGRPLSSASVRYLFCFTALHGMQTRSYDDSSVRPSVRPSVCLSVRKTRKL